MRDNRVKRLAEVLVGYSMGIKEGDHLVIDANEIAQPLIKEVFREAIRKGANVDTEIGIDGLNEIFLKEASDIQLEFVSPFRTWATSNADAFLSILGGYNTKELTNIDSKRMQKWHAAYGESFSRMLERIEKKELRWCGTQFPTHSSAQDANMSLDEYEDFVYSSMLLHMDDPVAEWKKISEKQEKLCRFLETKKSIHIKAQDTDLRFRMDGRRWINDDGKMNFPDGEIFTTPIEDSVEGYIRFSFPGIYMSREIEDIRLEFKEGKVVKASAAKGEDLLLTLLDTDEGSRRLGELAFGMNYGIQRFTNNILFDEKIGGTIHAALGGVPDDTGGNNESAIHWDMICDMRDGGEVYADGELIYKNGEFVVEGL